VYLFGGYNGTKFVEHLYQFEKGKNRWIPVKTTGKPPLPRCGCASVIVDQYLYIFGGYTADGHTNDLYRLNMDTFAWDTIDAKGQRPVARAYLQACASDGSLYIFGGYDGNKCVSDFRRIVVNVPSVDVIKVIREMDVRDQVSYVIKHFNRQLNGSMDTTDLEGLFSHLTPFIRKQPSAQREEQYPFSTVALGPAMNLGFTRDAVIACLTDLHSQGRDLTNMNAVVDRLMSGDYANAILAPDLSRQRSEKTELREKLQSALDEKDDLKTCKVCFEHPMDCFLQPCGHLSMCMKCGEDLKRKQLSCPLCRKQIISVYRVYWT